MSTAFAFHEPQPVIDEGDDGLPFVAVYPAGAAYPVIDHANGLVTVQLPSSVNEEGIDSTFPETAGTFSGVAAPVPATSHTFREAAALYPRFITAEDLDDYDAAVAQPRRD
jgi:hypothetical protein